MTLEPPIGFADLDKRPIPACYNAFLVDTDGRVVRVEKLAAREDVEALRQAKALVDGHAVELWDGVRYIEHFPSID